MSRKNRYLVKMTMLPMVIFVFFITVLKFGPFTPSFMENTAEASMRVPDYKQSFSTVGIFSAVKDWRQSKIIRSSLNYDPSLFYNLNDRDIRRLLGAPVLIRQDGQARMIQYNHGGCVAEFYYIQGENQKISHYEIRQLENNTASDCLSDILYNL